MAKKMTKRNLIITRVVLIIFGLVLILVLSLPELRELKKLRRSGNYEYGIVTELKYRSGGGKYRSGRYSVYFMSRRGYGKCEVSQGGFLGIGLFSSFGDSPRDRYKIGDRVNLVFDDSEGSCASVNDIGEMLSSCRIRVVLGLILVLGGIFMKQREETDND